MMRKTTLKISLVSACLCFATNVFADNHTNSFLPHISLDIALIGDNNVNKAQWENQISEDKFIDTRITGSYFQSPDRFNSISYFGTLSIEEYDVFKGLDKTALKLGVNWDFQFSNRFSTPMFHLSFAAEEADFETDIRDSTTRIAGANVAWRLTDAMTSTFGLTYKNSDALTKVFDTKEIRFFTNVDLILNDRITLFTTLSYIEGDIVSTARTSYAIVNWAEAIEPDNAFGGIAEGALAYRLQAVTAVLNLGLNYAINESNALDASVMLVETDAEGSNEYERRILRISYLTRF